MTTHEHGPAAVRAWVRDEQADLWSELDEAIRNARNGRWSIGCEYIVGRIVGAARLVGPTPHGDMPWNLVVGGVYEAVCHVAGVEPLLPADETEWRRVEDMMSKGVPHTVTTRAVGKPLYAATVDNIRAMTVDA